MKKGLALLLALLLLSIGLILPLAAETVPQNAAIAAARSEIRQTVGVDTPGAAVVLLENGDVTMLEGMGYADVSARVLVTPETVFEIGELSGLFVALTAYRLAEEGRLSFTEDIERYLPDAFCDKLGLSFPVTLEHLLLGSAGFEGRTFDLRFFKESHRFDSLEKAILAQVPHQIAAPGSFYAASPFGVALAAYVIETVVGESYSAYAQRELLQPLGMKQTVLDPSAKAFDGQMAVGHSALGNGQFLAAAGQGRSYAGLYPANGAVSSAADLSRLLTFLLSDGESAVLSLSSRQALLQQRYVQGIFPLSAPAMQVQGNAMGISAKTGYFGASLWLDSNRSAALVLTNAADSALLRLPAVLCGASAGVAASDGGALPDIELYEGHYADATQESNSFVGRLLRKDQLQRAAVSEENGTLSFLGMDLIQIAPGVFADAQGDLQTAVVQFVLDQEGKVAQVISARGSTYLPVKFFERKTPANALLALLVLLSVFFVGAGLFSLLRYLIGRGEERHKGFVYTLPLLFAAMIGLCTFLQMLVGLKYGGAAFSSFFGAMSVITMVFCVGALLTFLLAFMASLTRKGMTARVARCAILFLVYVFMIRYWGLLLL